MGNPARWALPFALLLGWLAACAPASAQRNRQDPPRAVQDDANLFSAAAKQKANADIAEIKRQFKKDLLVETVPKTELPKDLDKSDAKAVNDFITQWANERFKNHAINGIYVVLVKEPGKFRVAVGRRTEQAGLFTASNKVELIKLIQAKLTAKDADGALSQTTTFVRQTMGQNARTTNTGGGGAGAPATGMPPWVGYVCIGLVVLLVVWLVFGLIRGLSGAGAGGMVGGGGGGGGGGFMSGMLGGLFGAMAGMWMYNTFFGGHMSSASAADPGTGYDAGTDVGAGDADVGGGDYDSGGKDADAGGGDWGGGGDAGGGGGDWGGGGGGDWGGGGGDFGGGGGGDW